MKPVRTLFFLCLLAATLQSSAQRNDKNLFTKYYDRNWKEVPMTDAPYYYSEIEKKGKLWQKADYHFPSFQLFARGSYKDTSFKIPVDTFYYFYDNSSLERFGKFMDGKKEGIWRGYYRNGSMKDSVTYASGRPVLNSFTWHRNGYLLDSTSYTADGRSVSVKWFDNGNPSSAGRYDSAGNPIGKWVFFHKSGERSAAEVYENGVLKEKNYFDENGKPVADTANRDHDALFSNDKPFSKYLYEELKKREPDAERMIGGQEQLFIQIDDEGRSHDPEISFPFNRFSDSIVLDIINNSPRWIPAVSHNRKVPFTYSLFMNALSNTGPVMIFNGKDSIYQRVEIESEYPGGQRNWSMYLNREFRYPQRAINRNISGAVVVQFIVDAEGNVTDIQAISGNPILAEEAVRVIKKSGKWIPAIQDGKHVKSYKKQPIIFKLS